jgi:hypothetical protein
MLRYVLLVVGFLVLAVYLLVLGARGQISGRFKTVSLTLLGLLAVLAGVGLYYSHSHYAVDTVQEKFAENRESILERIERLQQRASHEEALRLAERYIREVQDPRLDKLYRRSREAELLERAERLEGKRPRELLSVWRELAELTQKETYRQRYAEQKRKLRDLQEARLLGEVRGLPENATARRMLGYRLLLELNPGHAAYKKRYDRYARALESRIQNSPWNDICSSTGTLAYCRHVGYVLKPLSQAGEDSKLKGTILGVSRRSKGTLVSRDGEVAPENGYYYIVDPGIDRLVLHKVDYADATYPFSLKPDIIADTDPFPAEAEPAR